MEHQQQQWLQYVRNRDRQPTVPMPCPRVSRSLICKLSQCCAHPGACTHAPTTTNIVLLLLLPVHVTIPYLALSGNWIVVALWATCATTQFTFCASAYIVVVVFFWCSQLSLLHCFVSFTIHLFLPAATYVYIAPLCFMMPSFFKVKRFKRDPTVRRC